MPPKQFGLIKKQGFAKGQGLGGKKPAAKPLIKPAAFGGDSSDEGEAEDDDDDAKDRRRARKAIDVKGVNASLMALQAQSRSTAEALQAKALAEDANVFAYDEVCHS